MTNITVIVDVTIRRRRLLLDDCAVIRGEDPGREEIYKVKVAGDVSVLSIFDRLLTDFIFFLGLENIVIQKVCTCNVCH